MAELTLAPSEYRSSMPAKPGSNKGALSEWAAVVREEEAHRASLRGPIILGLLTLVLGVGGFSLWAASTELSSAAVASGRVIVESNTKTVTHLEGGTLKELLVSDGDRVKAGDVLAMLDVTRSESTLLQLRQELFAKEAQLARLIAERDEDKSFAYEADTPTGMNKALRLTCSRRKCACSRSEPISFATRSRLTSRASSSLRASGWRSMRGATPG